MALDPPRDFAYRRSLWRAAVVCCSLVSTVTRLAVAQPRATLDLIWDAPPACPQENAVRKRVLAIAGPASRRVVRLQAEGKITRIDRHYRLRLSVRDGAVVGDRTIESESCEDLAGAAAVALGLLLHSEAPLTSSELSGHTDQGDTSAGDASATSEGAASAGGDSPDRERGNEAAGRSNTDDSAKREPEAARASADRAPGRASGAAPSDVSPKSPARPDASPRPRGAVLLAPRGVVELGPLPGASWGVGAAGGVHTRGWGLMVRGEWWSSQSVAAEALQGYAASVERMSGAVSVCRDVLDSDLQVSPCLTLALERLSASGTGPHVAPMVQRSIWISPGLSVIAGWRVLDALALTVEVGGRLELSRPRIVIEGIGNIYQMPPFAFSAALGPELIF